jgi:hypothetical protein
MSYVFGERVMINAGLHQGKIGRIGPCTEGYGKYGVELEDGTGSVSVWKSAVSPYPTWFPFTWDIVSNPSVETDWAVGKDVQTCVLLELLATSISESDGAVTDKQWFDRLSSRVSDLNEAVSDRKNED